MYYTERHGRRYAQFERLRQEPCLVHAFATRPLDVSPRQDRCATERAAHRADMLSDWDLDATALRYCIQIHEPHVEHVTHEVPPGPMEKCDGVFTTAPAVPLMCFSADCPLVLVYDPVRRVLGLAHASWRCTVARLAEQLVARMHEECACEPGKLLAGIGPGAGPCCYEVKSDVYAAAATLPQRDVCFASRDGHMYFDLWEANRQQLLAAGVAEANIELANVCTMCRNDLFFSFRCEGVGCGHFGLLAALRAD